MFGFWKKKQRPAQKDLTETQERQLQELSARLSAITGTSAVLQRSSEHPNIFVLRPSHTASSTGVEHPKEAAEHKTRPEGTTDADTQDDIVRLLVEADAGLRCEAMGNLSEAAKHYDKALRPSEKGSAIEHSKEVVERKTRPEGAIDAAGQDKIVRMILETNERGFASDGFVNPDALNNIAAMTEDPALQQRIQRLLAQGKRRDKSEIMADMQTLTQSKGTANQEKAVKDVIARNERALASGGYVDTFALTLAKVMTNDPKLWQRIDRLAKAKGMVIMRGDQT
jgi:hypothetical protein